MIDNATFHQGRRIEAWRITRPVELIEQAGCKVLCLPPYSPDLNQIEQCWFWFKSRIRQCCNEFNSLRDALEHILKLAS